MGVKQISLSDFLSRVEEIAAENPSYRTGGSGSDETCDCIGLIMGAVRRAGSKWPWLHSSNDAARKAVLSLEPIGKASDLSAGDLVFKHLKPGESGYDLPKRYAADPDQNDYTHVGVVLSVNPLRIRHMTSPSVKLDTKLGRWSHHGWCSLIRKEVSGSFTPPVSSPANIPEFPVPQDKSDLKGGPLPMCETITIESTNGLPVKLRSKPTTSCNLYWEIPSGASGTLLSEENGWCRVETEDPHGRTLSGWMKSEFVVRKHTSDHSDAAGSGANSAGPPGPASGPNASTNPVTAGAAPLTAAEAAVILTEAMELERHLDTIFTILGGRG